MYNITYSPNINTFLDPTNVEKKPIRVSDTRVPNNQIIRQKNLVIDRCETPVEDLDLDLEEFRARWWCDTILISEIVQLENELGRPLTMLDLFCRIDRRELDSVSYALHWLVEGDVPF